MEIRRDSPAFPRRGRDRVPEQRLSFLLAALEPAHQRPEQRNLHEQDQRDRTEDRRGERAEQAPGARGDRPESLVDLEEHRSSRGRADPGVRLDQAALPAVERVLRATEVTHLDLRAAFTEQTPLSRVERIVAADLIRIVRVKDSPVGRPDLDSDDRTAQHSRDDRIVDGSNRGRPTGDQAVRENRLDKLPRLLDLRPRLAFRLVDRNRAKREVATDDGDEDRDRAAEREAQKHRPRCGSVTSDVASPSFAKGLHRLQSLRLVDATTRNGTNVPLRLRPDNAEAAFVNYRRSSMFSSRLITLSVTFAVAAAALAVTPIASSKGGPGSWSAARVARVRPPSSS